MALSLDNALILKKWEGDTNDTSLIGLAQLLQGIQFTNIRVIGSGLSGRGGGWPGDKGADNFC